MRDLQCPGQGTAHFHILDASALLEGNNRPATSPNEACKVFLRETGLLTIGFDHMAVM